MRTIDADALKEYFFRPYSNEESYSNIELEKIIDSQLTIESEPKTGEWIDDGDPLTLKCSKCGYVVKRYNNTNFCPNCGVKMK